MRPSELAGDIYEENSGNSGFAALGPVHSFRMDLSDWSIDEDEVKFEADNFPYFKVALLDRWLEDTYESE